MTAFCPLPDTLTQLGLQYLELSASIPIHLSAFYFQNGVSERERF